MTYLISTEIRGFNYYVKVKSEIKNTYGIVYEHQLEGLKNNATLFTSRKDAICALSYLVSETPLNIIPYK